MLQQPKKGENDENPRLLARPSWDRVLLLPVVPDIVSKWVPVGPINYIKSVDMFGLNKPSGDDIMATFIAITVPLVLAEVAVYLLTAA